MFDNMDINYIINKTEYASQNWFQVVGYATSVDFATPIVDQTKPLPNTTNEALVYVSPKNFGLKYSYLDVVASSDEGIKKIADNDKMVNTQNTRIWYTNGDLASEETLKLSSDKEKEIYYVGKFNNQVDVDVAAKTINSYLTDLDQAKKICLHAGFVNVVNPQQNLVTLQGSLDYRYGQRTTLLQTTIVAYQVFSYIIIGVVMSIGVVMLVVMLNNQIKKSFGQMGVLTALGYKKSSLIWSNSLYPLFITFTGGLGGFLVGLVCQGIVINIINRYFAVAMQPFTFTWETLFVTLFGIFVFLELITLTVYFSVLNSTSPLKMINYENHSATNRFKLAVKKIFTRRKSFNARFQGAMLSSSIAKLVAVFNVMLVATGLLTIGSLLSVILTENKAKLYTGNNFDNLVEYESPVYNSPVSFYKTYDPTAPQLDFQNLSSSQLIDMYVQNQISAQAYSADTNLATLGNMTYKSFGIDFLKNPNLTIGTGQAVNSSYYKAIAINLWQDLTAYGLDTYWDKNQFVELLNSNTLAKERVEDLEKIRLFYLKYKNTIGIARSFWRPDYISGTILSQQNPAYLSRADAGDFQRTIQLNNDGSIKSNVNFNDSLYNYIDEGVSDTAFRLKRIEIMVPIYNWFVAMFFNNLQQAFLQGIYSASPHLIQDRITAEFDKEVGNFTIGFNLIPYSATTDDLGVYFAGATHGQTLKIYGIAADHKNQQLVSAKGEDLKPKLFANDTKMLLSLIKV
ncbi:ABC transporter permease [Spiroplasma clarkii]|nr:ABC transporter permease [Spiroplasma clarkii]